MSVTNIKTGMDSGPEDIADKPERFFNRELSWLQFNSRVLAESGNKNQPLLERVRFLSISALNLDEFYMVRVAGLRGQVLAGIELPSQDGLTPSEQLDRIGEYADQLTAQQQEQWGVLRNELEQNGIYVIDTVDLTETEYSWLEDLFLNQIFPVLTPIAVDPAHPFPFIPTQGFTLGLELFRASQKEPMARRAGFPRDLP